MDRGPVARLPLLGLQTRRSRCAPEERERIDAELFSDGAGELRAHVYRVATLTGLSATIAALGLIQSSSAVVIGAMLVSPLMQPMIGLAAALVGIERRRQVVTLALIVFASAESVGIGALTALVAPTFRTVTITPEILQRTAPGIADLAIACAAGAAGAYVTVRRQAAAALPGAAIAVALMPPLATVGILAERGNEHLAAGALLLFVTNLLGIIVSSAIVLSLTGYTPDHVPRRREWLAVVVPLATVALVAYPLERESSAAYRRAKDEAVARSVVIPPLRDGGLGIQDLTVVERGGELVASVDVAGPEPPAGADTLARSLAGRVGRPATVILRWTRRSITASAAAPSGR